MSEIMSEVTDVFNKQRIDKTRYEALLKHFRLNITEKLRSLIPRWVP